MRVHAHVTDPAPPTYPAQDSLYRLVFVGGPFDGHETQSALLPDEYFQLRPGPAPCKTETGLATTSRLAQYRLVKSKLVICSQDPVVLCRFEYCGPTLVNASKTAWWRRCLIASWRGGHPRNSNLPM